MRTYKLILELNINHDYYPKGKISADDLEIIPIPQTETTLKNYRMVLKSSGNQIKVSYEYERDEKSELPSIELKKELKFTFLIKQKNPLFINFTEIPFITMNREIVYLSNKKKNKIIEKGSLSEGNFIEEKDVIPFLPKDIELITDNKNIDFKILNSDKEIVENHKKGESAVDTSINFIQKNPNGKYSIKIKNQETDFVLFNAKTDSGTIGYIEIFIDKNAIKSIEKNNKPLSYSINFKPRNIFWQYYIIQKYNSLDNIQIIDEAKELNFELEEELMNNDKAAKIFTSIQKTILLKENTKNLKLVSKNGNKSFEKVLYEKLPFPDIKNIGKHKTKEEEYTCKSFIYI